MSSRFIMSEDVTDTDGTVIQTVIYDDRMIVLSVGDSSQFNDPVLAALTPAETLALIRALTACAYQALAAGAAFSEPVS